jgi:exonuclease VII small subunit
MADFHDMLSKIQNCMQKAGDFRIGDTALSEVDAEQLLNFHEESVHEHWKIHAAALAYFSHLYNQAQTELEDYEAQMQQAILRDKGILTRLAKEEYGLSRPSKDDIQNLAIVLSEKDPSPLHQDFREFQEGIKYYKSAVRDLKSWVDAWEKKGFSLNGLTSVTTPQKFHS